MLSNATIQSRLVKLLASSGRPRWSETDLLGARGNRFNSCSKWSYYCFWLTEMSARLLRIVLWIRQRYAKTWGIRTVNIDNILR